MLATLVDPPPARRVRIGLVAGGLVLPLLLAIYQLFVLGLDPLGGAWYLLLLVLGGQVGLGAVLVAALFAAVLGSVLAIVGRSGPDRQPSKEVGVFSASGLPPPITRA
jgi:hypothetical protein